MIFPCTHSAPFVDLKTLDRGAKSTSCREALLGTRTPDPFLTMEGTEGYQGHSGALKGYGFGAFARIDSPACTPIARGVCTQSSPAESRGRW